jgi:hypothetical protein
MPCCRASRITYIGGLMWCSRAQFSFSTSDMQQQCRQHSSAEAQPH